LYGAAEAVLGIDYEDITGPELPDWSPAAEGVCEFVGSRRVGDDVAHRYTAS
jgi:hypothetical protein